MKRVLFILAVALASPGAALASDVTMVSRDVAIGSRTLQSVAAPIRFNLLGLHWQGTGAIEYRTRAVGGGWGLWRAADADVGPDTASPERRRAGWVDGNLDWVGASKGVQFRTSGRVTRLRAFYLFSKSRKLLSRTLSLADSPSIVARTSWLADEKIKRAKARYAPSLRLAVVHHTAGSNAYTPAQAAAIVRGIQIYHVKANGWNDIGYNFLVDKYGNIYEGRAGGMDRNVIGAHSQGFNTGTVGVALIGNHSALTPSQVAQDALVSLLAWRLDAGHLDPLTRVRYASGGNLKFRAGKAVTLGAITAHRNTGPSECPGARAYSLLSSLTDRIAATGLPKLYAPTATGALGGKIRFQGRLSSVRPWAVTVTSAAGKVVARGTGRSALVDWTWDSLRAGKGPFIWAIAGGAGVLPATGSLGGTVSSGGLPTAPPLPAPFTGLLSGLSVTPSALAPAADGSGMTTTVGFTLAGAAFVTVRVTAGTSTLVTLLAATVAAGQSSFQWDLSILANGRYRVMVTAQQAGAAAVTQAAELVVDRTLSGFAASPAVFSPNGDGAADTVNFSFALAQPAAVQLVVQRAGVPIGTIYSAQLGAGAQAIGWDGSVGGVRLPDGEYVAVLTSTGPLGAVSLLLNVIVDTTPPLLSLVDGATLRFQVSEPSAVSALVNGQVVTVADARAAFTLAWAGGTVSSLTAQARDFAGNPSAAVTWP